MFNNNAWLLRVRVTMVTLKSCDLIGRSRILEHVQLDVRGVTRPSFSQRLKGVACETIKIQNVILQNLRNSYITGTKYVWHLLH